jgi:cell division protein FtsA
VVIHNEALARAQEIIRLANLEASFFEIEIFSTIRSVLEHESSPVMIFDMGAGSTKLYIVDRGILRLSHIVTRGSQDMTLAISKSLNISVEEAESLKRERGISPAAKPGMPGVTPAAPGVENGSLAAVTPEQLAQIMLPTLNYIFSEANRVLFNYQKKYNKNVAKVVLTGGGAALKGFADIAKKEMQTAVESANPFAKTDAPAFLQQLLAQSGPEFSVSIGLALRRLQELK